MAEVKKVIVGYFEIDKNSAAMPCLAGEEKFGNPLYEKWELDANGALMPKDEE